MPSRSPNPSSLQVLLNSNEETSFSNIESHPFEEYMESRSTFFSSSKPSKTVEKQALYDYQRFSLPSGLEYCAKDPPSKLGPSTKGDKKFESTRNFFKVAYRASDIALVLETSLKTLSNPSVSQSKKREVLKSIKNSIIPLQPKIAEVLIKAANDLAPISTMQYLHERN